MFCVSSSIPANDNTKLGPTVFSGAIGMPNSSHVLRKTYRSLAHDVSDLLTIRKSSNKCNMPGICNLKRAIHSRPELKHSNILQELESKISINIESIRPANPQQIVIEGLTGISRKAFLISVFASAQPLPVRRISLMASSILA